MLTSTRLWMSALEGGSGEGSTSAREIKTREANLAAAKQGSGEWAETQQKQIKEALDGTRQGQLSAKPLHTQVHALANRVKQGAAKVGRPRRRQFVHRRFMKMLSGPWLRLKSLCRSLRRSRSSWKGSLVRCRRRSFEHQSLRRSPISFCGLLASPRLTWRS